MKFKAIYSLLLLALVQSFCIFSSEQKPVSLQTGYENLQLKYWIAVGCLNAALDHVEENTSSQYKSQEPRDEDLRQKTVRILKAHEQSTKKQSWAPYVKGAVAGASVVFVWSRIFSIKK